MTTQKNLNFCSKIYPSFSSMLSTPPSTAFEGSTNGHNGSRNYRCNFGELFRHIGAPQKKHHG